MLDILIPAYNCSATLGNTLQSLVDQKTTETFHVIVYDDASIENLQEIVQEFSDKLDITYIRGEFNRGVGGVRQQLIMNSIAPFFTFLDADDIVHPNFVSTFYFLVNNDNSQEYDIFVTDIIEMRADGSSKICDKYGKIDSRVKVIHKENGGLSSARNCGINNSSVGFKCLFICNLFIFTFTKYFGKYSHNDKFPINKENTYIKK